MACNLVLPISGTECIGDSRVKINNNFESLCDAVNALSAETVVRSPGGTTQTINNYAIGNGRVLYSDVRNNSLSAIHISNEAITTDKILTEAITTDKIAPDTVRYSQLASWQTLSASPTLSAEAVQPRLAKAWVTFNGDPASPTIYSQFNVSSVTKTTPGAYQINFTTALPTSAFAVTGLSQDLSNGDYSSNGFHIMLEGITLPAKTTNYVRIRTYDGYYNAFSNATDISVLIYSI